MNSRYRLITPLFLLSMGLIFLGRALPDDRLLTVIGGIHDRYGNAEGLTATYTREAISKTMAMLGEAERHDLARGKLYFSPPSSVRLEQVSPHQELLLTDGQTLWWYLPLKKEAYKYPAEKFGKELRLLSDILTGLKASEDSFQMAFKEIPETDTYDLFLRPEPPWQDIDYLKVVIRKGDFAIRRVEIYNNIGGLTRFLLTEWEEKHRFEREFFSFCPPPGVKLIEE